VSEHPDSRGAKSSLIPAQKEAHRVLTASTLCYRTQESRCVAESQQEGTGALRKVNVRI
jgi:hypothetical protein